MPTTGRREFLAVLGAAGARALAPSAVLFGSGCAVARRGSSPSDLFGRLVLANDRSLPSRLARQQMRAGHPRRGGVPDRHGIYTAGGAAGLVRSCAAGYTASASRYFRAAALREPMLRALEHLLSIQHDDGTVDLHTTNFHSPPDTAFILEPICLAASLLGGLDDGATAEVRAALRKFIERAAGALAVGGIHTPNHRWVVGRALARSNALYPDPRYVERVDEWLAEGIDIDPDGQFTERSVGVYSPITDRCLLTMARLLERPELLAPVRANLTMTMHYVHADGELVTDGSRRQDRTMRRGPSGYYVPYRHLAVRDGDGRFAAMARWIEAVEGERLAGFLADLLDDPTLRAPMPQPLPLPTDFARAFPRSGLVRIRRGDVSATILAQAPTLFAFHKGAAALEAVRLAAAFFGKGQFDGVSLQRRGGAWVMRSRLTAPYYQPLAPDQRRADGQWDYADREPGRRRRSEVQRLRYELAIRETDGAFSLGFDVRGTDRVPVAIELAFRRGGSLSGVVPVDGVADAWLLKDGFGSYRDAGQTITFGPGRAAHTYTQLRGALPKCDGDSVYLTGFTPFRAELRIA